MKKRTYIYVILFFSFFAVSLTEMQVQCQSKIHKPFSDKVISFSDIENNSNIFSKTKNHKRETAAIPTYNNNYQTFYYNLSHEANEKNRYALNATGFLTNIRNTLTGQSRINTGNYNETFLATSGSPGYQGSISMRSDGTILLPDLNTPGNSDWIGFFDDPDELPDGLDDPDNDDWIAYGEDAPIGSAHSLFILILCYIIYRRWRTIQK